MSVIKCKVEWESDDWSYIIIQGDSELRYTKVPSSLVVNRNNDSHIFVEKVSQWKRSWGCVLKDVRYPEYDFIHFNIRNDQFVDDESLESEIRERYEQWCKSDLQEKIRTFE